MGDYEIRGQFEAGCGTDEMKRWLTSSEGIAGWWSDTVTGDAAKKGDNFAVAFPTSPVDFELTVEEASDDAVEWHVPENPPWWKGTSIRFEITDGDDGGTSVRFSHRGFDPADPIIDAITPAWVRFVDNLVRVAETGEANPAVVN